MKKMMRNWMTITLMSILLFGFTACSSDDDKVATLPITEENLDGTWEINVATVRVVNLAVPVTAEQIRQTAQQQGVTIWDDKLTFNGSYVNGTPYTIVGNSISIPLLNNVNGFSDMTITIVALTPTTLILRETVTLEGLPIVVDITYDRISGL